VAFVLPALFLIVPRWGSMGASVVFVCLNLLQLIVVPALMHSVILRSELFRWYVRDVAIPTAAAVAGVWAVSNLVSQDGLGRVGTCVTAFGAAAVGVAMATAVADLARGFLFSMLPACGGRAV
jgi:hypothetical protein